MDAKFPRLFTYAMALVDVVLFSEDENEKLIGEKFEALQKTWAILESYAKHGFSERILDIIMEKKYEMLQEATKISDVREITVPKAPEYLWNGWSISKFSVPEEEMIWWSMTCSKVPLIDVAFKRYQELFNNFYNQCSNDTAGEDKS